MLKNKKTKCCANCGTLEKYYVQTQCPNCGYIGDKLEQIILNDFEGLYFVEVSKYTNNDTPAITIYSIEEDEYGTSFEPFLELTTNFDCAEVYLCKNEIMVKTWGENEEFLEAFLNSGLFEDTGRRVVVSQWCKASVWKVKKIKLKG